MVPVQPESARVQRSLADSGRTTWASENYWIEVLLSNKELQSGETGEAGWLAVGLKLEEEQYVGIRLNSLSPSI